ncbi:6-hydroxymethylpterin diphosphokinase MptE-like protein [Aliiroseovarius sp.]|uniref:6-hydroxymethylpterin diphosphokinase MptE-like protein n=1 Tax=Aliiroseovarius sp. TaxID=1872442 RepID=UPI00261B728B|nr:6-hydroxymethylpterin diphosphokinase MptE-like protein [Aliiroseovarius sp.]
MEYPVPADPASPLLRFRDLHAGARAVIVCNGPSLNHMDLSFLRREVTFGLNKIHLGLPRFGFYPRYLVAVNDRVIAQEAAAFRAMTCIKFLTSRAADLLSQDALTYHIHTTGLGGRFYRDITMGVHEGHTVTHAALQIAYYMGFSEVVIIGMDHRFEAHGTPDAPQHLAGPDPNHFSPDYFRDQTWDLPNLEESEISYRAARDIYAAEGRRIVDATLNGACDIFEKVYYKKLFGI